MSRASPLRAFVRKGRKERKGEQAEQWPAAANPPFDPDCNPFKAAISPHRIPFRFPLRCLRPLRTKKLLTHCQPTPESAP
jgi:hypothetical protein